MPTPALRLSPRATPEWKRVQPLSRGLVPGPKPCVEVSPTISSRNRSASRTFPNREVTFHVPRAMPHAHILFVDFSSAFNTLHSHLLTSNLKSVPFTQVVLFSFNQWKCYVRVYSVRIRISQHRHAAGLRQLSNSFHTFHKRVHKWSPQDF